MVSWGRQANPGKQTVRQSAPAHSQKRSTNVSRGFWLEFWVIVVYEVARCVGSVVAEAVHILLTGEHRGGKTY